tara:strand:- start:666 stop:947 length:282 start_codon:yes stop_codon:yes gene_type:complete
MSRFQYKMTLTTTMNGKVFVHSRREGIEYQSVQEILQELYGSTITFSSQPPESSDVFSIDITGLVKEGDTEKEMWHTVDVLSALIGVYLEHTI